MSYPYGSLEVASDVVTMADTATIMRVDGGWRLTSMTEPAHYLRNLLVLDGDPSMRAPEEVRSAFTQAFAGIPEPMHESLCWTGSPDEHMEVPSAYIEQDFYALRFATLRWSDDRDLRVSERSVRHPFVVRTIPADDDDGWREILDVYVAVNNVGVDTPDEISVDLIIDSLRESITEPLRRLVKQHRAQMWCVVADGKVVAVAPLVIGHSLARFQAIATHPHWQGRGLCSALIRAVVADISGNPAVHDIVLVSEQGSAAERLYRSLGFAVVERSLHLVHGGATEYWRMQNRGQDPYTEELATDNLLR